MASVAREISCHCVAGPAQWVNAEKGGSGSWCVGQLGGERHGAAPAVFLAGIG